MAEGKRAGQGGSLPNDKGKGKEVKPLPEAKGFETNLKLKDAIPKVKDVASKVKEADPKSKEVDPKATSPPVSQSSSKDDPPLAKA